MQYETLVDTVGKKVAAKTIKEYNKAEEFFKEKNVQVTGCHGMLKIAGRFIYSPLGKAFRVVGNRKWYFMSKEVFFEKILAENLVKQDN